MDNSQLMKLVLARIDGVWDDPALLEFGYLRPDPKEDIKRMVNYYAPSEDSRL